MIFNIPRLGTPFKVVWLVNKALLSEQVRTDYIALDKLKGGTTLHEVAHVGEERTSIYDRVKFLAYKFLHHLSLKIEKTKRAQQVNLSAGQAFQNCLSQVSL